jgi:hypothetical protein
MFRVRWVRSALNELAAVWTLADDRGAVTSAVHQIDEALKVDPEARGESRDKGRRILLVPPLAVIFKTDPLDRTVSVLAVWRFTRRRDGS